MKIKDGVPHYSIEEYNRMLAGENPAATRPKVQKPEAVRPNKYGAEKTMVDNISFDSKAEAKRYEVLKLLRITGEVTWFHRQPSFLLTGGIRYRPDFIIQNQSGQLWVEDVKGHPTKDFIIKSKLFRAEYPGLELRIITKEDQ